MLEKADVGLYRTEKKQNLSIKNDWFHIGKVLHLGRISLYVSAWYSYVNTCFLDFFFLISEKAFGETDTCVTMQR